ncbi:hypothetical protein SRHO_G00068910 [Serrasalmus rhombeus]
MAALKEELRQRDSTMQSLREQLLSSNQQQSPRTADTSTQTNPSTFHLNLHQITEASSTFYPHKLTAISSQPTRTNDLRAQQQRVTVSLRAVIEKASSTFPNSKIIIIISTLLPHMDFHLYTIRKMNASISREHALRPNPHLAHHPTLDTACLYDHIQLFQELVPAFAKTLKDVTLTHNVTTLQRKAGRNSNTLPSRRTPRPADGATPQALHLRPRHHAPQYPEQPDRQMRHRNHPNLPPAQAPMAGTLTLHHHPRALLPLPNNSRPGQEHRPTFRLLVDQQTLITLSSETYSRCSAKSALV